jgi:hypothetical protein
VSNAAAIAGGRYTATAGAPRSAPKDG